LLPIPYLTAKLGLTIGINALIFNEASPLGKTLPELAT